MRYSVLVVALMMSACGTDTVSNEGWDHVVSNPSDADCVPETALQLCAAQKQTCGVLVRLDSCGGSRTVNCGVCPGLDASLPPPDAEPAITGLDAGLPEPDADLPALIDATTPPGLDAEQPGLDAAATAGEDAEAPGWDAAQPGRDASAPGLDAACPGLDAGPVDPCKTLNCEDNNKCTVDSCSGGVCHNDPTVGYVGCFGASGKSGVCAAGVCCEGCVLNGVCMTGNTMAACGRGGQACADYSTSDSCSWACVSGTFTFVPQPKDTICVVPSTKGSGLCNASDTCVACGQNNKQCCQSSTCDTGLSCLSGTCKPNCVAGTPCIPTNTCHTGKRAAVTCACEDIGTPMPEDYPCSGGVCRSGVCTNCGNTGLNCCFTGAACASPNTCNPYTNPQKCELCGHRGVPCCIRSYPDDGCYGGSFCGDGTCQ